MGCNIMLQDVAGPKTSAEALRWIQDAVAKGQYLVHEPHFSRRCAQRRVTLPDWKKAIREATSCKPHDRVPTCGGTAWRVTGTDIEGDELSIGVEAFRDHLGERALLVTVL
jgi:hypothetical protein